MVAEEWGRVDDCSLFRTVCSTVKVQPLWGTVSLQKNLATPTSVWKKKPGTNVPQLLPEQPSASEVTVCDERGPVGFQDHTKLMNPLMD